MPFTFKLLSREKWLQDTVEHTFLAFQGVTIGCAKCHDHMFDPLLQTEYYQIRAIFEPHNVRTDRIPGEPDTKKDGLPRAYDKDLTAVTPLTDAALLVPHRVAGNRAELAEDLQHAAQHVMRRA